MGTQPTKIVQPDGVDAKIAKVHVTHNHTAVIGSIFGVWMRFF